MHVHCTLICYVTTIKVFVRKIQANERNYRAKGQIQKPRGLTRITTSNCSYVHKTPNIRAYGSYMSIIAYLSVVKIIEDLFYRQIKDLYLH